MAIISEITVYRGFPRKYNVEPDINNIFYLDILQEDRTWCQVEIFCESLEEAKLMLDWTDEQWDIWYNNTDKPDAVKAEDA